MGISNQYKISSRSTKSLANLPNLVCYFDASYSDSVIIENGSVVSWIDKGNKKFDMSMYRESYLPKFVYNGQYISFIFFDEQSSAGSPGINITNGTMIISTPTRTTVSNNISISYPLYYQWLSVLASKNVIGVILCSQPLSTYFTNLAVSYFQSKGGGPL